MHVNVATVRIAPRMHWLRAVEARIEGQVVKLGASAYGQVTRVLAREGTLVEKRQLLVELDVRDLDRKVEEAAAELAGALGRAVEGNLRDGPVLSRVEIAPTADVKLARARYTLALLHRSNAAIHAPVSGRVLATWVRARDHVTLAQPLISILDSDDLWILARFGAPDLGCLRVGQPASVRVGGLLFEATVSTIAGPDDPVLLEFAGRRPGALEPGMVASVAVDATEP